MKQSGKSNQDGYEIMDYDTEGKRWLLKSKYNVESGVGYTRNTTCIYDTAKAIWIPVDMFTEQYNDKGKTASRVIERFDTVSGTWTYISKTTFDYNYQGKEIEFIYSEWNELLGEWTIVQKNNTEYFYPNTIDLNLANKKADFSVGPNPSSGIVYLYNMPPDTHVEISMLQGKIISIIDEQSETASIKLPQGLYIFNLVSAKAQSHTVVIVR